MQVGDFVAADAGSDDLDAAVLQFFADQSDVALGADAGLSDGIAQEDDPIAFFQGQSRFRRAGGGGEKEQGRGCREAWTQVRKHGKINSRCPV